MLSRFLCVGICALSLASAATVSSQPTFYKDVLPVMQKRCQNCHRPGEVAPISFLMYKDVRPWAKAIREAVLTKKMPPWFADAHYGKFANDRSLAQDEIDTLVSSCASRRRKRCAAASRVGGWLEHRKARYRRRNAA